MHELERELLAAEGVDAGAVEALRALAAAERQHHRQVGAQLEGLTTLFGRRVQLPRTQRPPRHDVAGRLQSLDGEAQAEALDERPQQTVGHAEVGVGLERQARDTARRGDRHDRTAGEAAAADGHVRPGLLEDAPDVRHGGAQQLEGARVGADVDAPLEPLELERVGRVLLADALDLGRRRHDDDARAPGLRLSRDGERRLQVTSGPPRCQQNGRAAER